ncbi:MAG: DUF4301 family protein [Crocinitomicaceae bacterium]|nr:DUF4301 family protein [Crocinitomicaceae bacterium]
MDKTNLSQAFESQKKYVFQEQPKLKIIAACNLNSGIVLHNSKEKEAFQQLYISNNKCKKSFFIPASGAGSRMFQFLFDFMNNDQTSDNFTVESFIQNLDQYAFYYLINDELKTYWQSGDVRLEELFQHILFKNGGLNLSELPKGLIPFHRFSGFILNAFQEHYMQGIKLGNGDVSFHFTIDKNFEKEIKGSLKTVQKLSATKCPVSFSEQDPETHAFAFDLNGNIVLDEHGLPLRRPAGHGALLPNLNTVQGDIIFIKNIDNVQHLNKSRDSILSFQYLGGLLLHLQDEFKRVYTHSDILDEFKKLNEQYHLVQLPNADATLTVTEIKNILNRPIRVCGMVRNEGQPGGGPFWVEIDGLVTKQIVEKSQIDMRGDQYKLMVQSKYFNPVMIAATKKDLLGKTLNLADFADQNQYFIVEKKFQGKPIKFMEQPGLWNGSMAHWNSVFVELSGNIFTPVKMITDLLRPEHLEV